MRYSVATCPPPFLSAEFDYMVITSTQAPIEKQNNALSNANQVIALLH